MKTLALGLLLIPCISSAQVTYDLLLKGGHVIDPKNHVNAVVDVAVAQGKIAAVAAGIPASKAHKTVNVARSLTCPSDMICRFFQRSRSEAMVRPSGKTVVILEAGEVFR